MDPSLFTDVINSYLPEPHASLLNGIIFGEKLKTSQEFYEKLKVVGLVHIVVLSGANITLLSSIISSITFWMGKKMSTLLTIVGIVIFVLFVGADPPIVRAAVMGILASIAILYGRKNIILYSLILSAVGILVIKPDWLSSISFQLSYAATFGLILFGKAPSNTKNYDEGILHNLGNYGKNELRTSLAAQAFTVPLIFIYFQQISFISPLSNIAVVWTIAPLMIFGFFTAILGAIHPILGLIPSYVCYITLSYIIGIIHILSLVPFASLDLSTP